MEVCEAERAGCKGRFKGTPLQLTPGVGAGGTASSLLCIFKDGADIGQKEVTRLREQNTSEGDMLPVRVDGESQGLHICLS